MKLTFILFMLCLIVFIVIISYKNKDEPKKENHDNRFEKIAEQLNESSLDDDKYQKINTLVISNTNSINKENVSGFENKNLEDLKKLKTFIDDLVSFFNKREKPELKDDFYPLQSFKCNYKIQDLIEKQKKGPLSSN